MDQKDGFILIGTVTIVLIIFLLVFFLILLIYRKRKVEHAKEVDKINETHRAEILNTQLEIQQQTMQDLGREIHDNVGQKLTLASLYTQQLSFENKYPVVNERIETIGSIINNALAELRSLSRTLTSDYIQQTELTELIKTECERVNALGKCTVVYHIAQGKIPLDDTRKKVTLRIVQEFLQNSLKHARCKVIDILVRYEDSRLQIIAKDDGAGFDTAKGYTGIGLENMKKRAEMIGAAFSINSSLNTGTEISFSLVVK